jgi:DNA-binding HxlR family transcriptional regulator
MLGVGPYITGSIIMQLLTIMSPRLKEMYQEEGEAGRMKFAQYSRLVTVPLAVLIIRDLLKMPMRFCELERSLEGISTRTLTLKLKRLEQEKIVIKNDLYYKLSTQGKKLQKIIDAMESWGKNNS